MALPGDETILAAMTDSRTASDAVTIRRATDDDTELVIVGRLRFLCDVRGLTPDGLSDEFLTANRRFIERTHGRSFHSWLATTDRDVVGIVSLVIFDAPPRPEERRDRRRPTALRVPGVRRRARMDEPVRVTGGAVRPRP